MQVWYVWKGRKEADERKKNRQTFAGATPVLPETKADDTDAAAAS